MVAWGLSAAALLLVMPAAADAQHGFSAAPRAAEQQEPPPPQGGNGPVAEASNSNGAPAAGTKTGRPRRGSESSRGTTDRRGTPTTGVSPATTGGGEHGGTLPLAKAQGGRLPFTGFDLMLVAFLGVMLLGAGFAVRAATRVRGRRPAA
jgi:hypothetical protein